MILAGDIGGTKTVLALFEWGEERSDPTFQETYWSTDYPSFEEILTEFLQEAAKQGRSDSQEEENADAEASAAPPPSLEDLSFAAACFGVAGPVQDNRSRTTNLPWEIDGETLKDRLRTPHVRIINDVEAFARSVLLLRLDEVHVLNPGKASESPQTKALIAAGTGLGEAMLFWDGTRYQAAASEGGHADFAPNSDLEIDLLRYLRTTHLHVSYERVLSGAGIHAIYQFLRDTKHNEPTWLAERLKTGDPAAIISEAGLTGKAEIASQTLEMFCSIYGAEAGNLALKCFALGGIYLGGGIAPKVLPKLQEGAFMRAFTAKGRYKRLMASIPVSVILNPNAGLLGAASLAASLVERT